MDQHTPPLKAASTVEHRPEAARVPQHDRGVIVTIDGPAGTGKSSVAHQLARSLGLEFLDTGAMYRAAALIVIDHGLSLEDPVSVARAVRNADIRFDWDTNPPTLYAAATPLTDRLRDPDVSANVSPVSQLPEVRAVLVERQRRIGEAHPRLVSEGRDQGSVVFHDADAKFYLDASIDIRTERRIAQLAQRGIHADHHTIRAEIADRDRRDSSREVGPLLCPDDAIRVGTDELTQQQVVERLAALVRERVGDRRLREAAQLA
jgi:cytidylate kinase